MTCNSMVKIQMWRQWLLDLKQWKAAGCTSEVPRLQRERFSSMSEQEKMRLQKDIERHLIKEAMLIYQKEQK